MDTRLELMFYAIEKGVEWVYSRKFFYITIQINCATINLQIEKEKRK